jgi:hypothetical protein
VSYKFTISSLEINASPTPRETQALKPEKLGASLKTLFNRRFYTFKNFIGVTRAVNIAPTVFEQVKL